LPALYIHIPYCLQKCRYCGFVSFPVNYQEEMPSTAGQKDYVPDAYIDALCQEMRETAEQRYFSGDNGYKYTNNIISTVYVGGGTPSLLAAAQLARIIAGVKSVFALADDAEFTLEANPETYTREKFLAYRALGVNRISLGIQSFQPEYLRYLGRAHSREKAAEALRGAREIFDNVSVDLLNNLPGQTLEQSAADLRTALDFQPRHISCYELTVERGTPLATERGTLAAEKTVRNELGAEMYLQTKKILEDHGYAQYEISNYAQAGYASRHNLAYWSDEPYLGLGLAAHSYDKARKLRRANTRDLKNYLQKIFHRESEPENDFNKIMMGLRKNSGIPETYLDERQKAAAQKLVSEELLVWRNNNLCATNRGRLVLNQVLLELM
jgi:oxygen-independent coproporphyrinogen-3 oxidase